MLMMSCLISFRHFFSKKTDVILAITTWGVVPSGSPDSSFVSCILLFFVISLIILSIKKYFILFISISSLVGFATLSLFFPLFGYVFVLLSTISLVFLPVPNYSFLDNLKLAQKSILFNVCQILKDSALLDFLGSVYLVIWCLSTKTFFKLLSCFFLINISYVFISRYYFVTCIMEHKSFSINESLLIYLCLILGLIALYTRFVLNLSLIVINYTLNYHRELLSSDFLLIVQEQSEGNPIPDSTNPSTSNKSRQFVFFQRNHNNIGNVIPNATTTRRMGFAGLFCSLCIGGGTIHYAKKAYDVAQLNNFEMTRQNDATEVELGIMTKEEYIKKYKKGPD